MNARDPRAATCHDQAIWARLVEQLDDQSFYGFLCDLAGLRAPSGTGRSSARSASAPAAGTPTSPTPSWRSCASSTPRPTTTTAASSAAAQQLPLRLWEREPERSRTGRRAPRWPPCTAAAARPAVTRLHRTAGNRITVTDADGRHPHRIAAAVFTAAVLDAALQDRLRRRAVPRSTTGRRSSAPTTWSRRKLFVPVDRPFWLDNDERHRPGRDVHDAHRPDDRAAPTCSTTARTGRRVICLSYTWCDDSLKWLPLLRATSGWRSC